jgi:hypothetical protein
LFAAVMAAIALGLAMAVRRASAGERRALELVAAE